MNLYKKVIYASGALFGICWLGVKVIEYKIDDTLLIATIEALESKEIEDYLVNYLGNVFTEMVNDEKIKNELKQFYMNTFKDQNVNYSVKAMMFKGLQNKSTFANFATASRNILKKLNFKPSDEKILDKQIKSAFIWKNSNLIANNVTSLRLTDFAQDTKVKIGLALAQFHLKKIRFDKIIKCIDNFGKFQKNKEFRWCVDGKNNRDRMRKPIKEIEDLFTEKSELNTKIADYVKETGDF